MLTERGLIRVGIEIEVASFERDYSYRSVARILMDKGFMLGNANTWETTHRYGCTCEPGGCGKVRTGDVFIPPLVSLTYDASLPETGAEFVVSPVLLMDDGLSALKDIWDIVTEHAVWDDKTESRAGGPCSPSIHLHVSATLPRDRKLLSSTRSTLLSDTLHALSLFGPEFIALASTTEYKRGLDFRQPIRVADQGGHHGFIHCRSVIPNEFAYIEWRTFEAAYNNWDYVLASAYMAAAITRALLEPDAYKRFMVCGFNSPLDDSAVMTAVMKNNTDDLLHLVDRTRLRGLRDICIDELTDDEAGIEILTQLFDRTELLYA